MKTFFMSLALVLFMEGVGFALFPGLARKGLSEMLEMSDSGLRMLGVAALICAILLGLLVMHLNQA